MTIYAEVLNVFNHANYRFDSYNGYDPTTGQAYISLLKMFRFCLRLALRWISDRWSRLKPALLQTYCIPCC